jgi:hypothetical protein
MSDRQTLTLAQVSFGVIAHDQITGAKGKVTAKLERMNGMHSVAIEGNSSGRPYLEWVDLDRLELDA